MKYFGIVFLPFSWLFFICQYTGREKVVRPRYIVLSLIEPLMTILLVWTNEFHGLIWSTIKLNTVGSMVVRISTHGQWFWVHSTYSYIFFLVGTILLFRNVFYRSSLPSHQVFMLLLALLCPWFGNFLYISRLNPFPGLDWTPFGFSITALSIAFGVLRYRLLDITPIAYDMVFKGMSDIVIVLDELDRVVELNPAAQQIIGQSRWKWFGRPARDILLPWKDLVEKYRAVNDVNSEIRAEINGVEHYFDLRISPLIRKGGQSQGRIIVLRDISERRKIEEELWKYKNHLEEMVKDRTAELEKSNRELATINRELEQFAYVASHDLQEPLRMVTSYVQLLERRYKDKLDKDANEFIDFAVDGAMRMHRLINDLLTYSRVGTRGKLLAPTDSEAVFEQSLSNLQVAIEEKGAQVTHEPLPKVMADDVQLGQLFQNLVGNAIKFQGEEQPRVHISAHQSNGEWVFSVKDNGIGIAPEFKERIFVIFQRLHGKEKYPGTGIGLAVCKKIVERQGGRIWVESDLGKGATFYFTLPFFQEQRR
jgi:PAS domain S-box-containing protein